ncbi:hypothetical protein V8E51_001299 [Hyaloscypha variabilis]
MSFYGLADILSQKMFRLVVNDPKISSTFLRFCRAQFCGENMEFLIEVQHSEDLLADAMNSLSNIQQKYLSAESPLELGLPSGIRKDFIRDIENCKRSSLPALTDDIIKSKAHIETLLLTNSYPMFVKNQMTTNVREALGKSKNEYHGLGDCFCITDPTQNDNPIVSASDGFVHVTGYSRSDIIARNCRFLQGKDTSRDNTQRLKVSIDSEQESIELLLNYKKNGQPFWNLVLVAPLFDETGKIAFFFGAQVDCSSAIHTWADLLQILSPSSSDKEMSFTSSKELASSNIGVDKTTQAAWTWSRFRAGANFIVSRRNKKINFDLKAVGEQDNLVNEIQWKKLDAQIETFYTTYSKYIILSVDGLQIRFHSRAVVAMLNTNGQIDAKLLGKNIFKVLNKHTSSRNGLERAVKESLTRGVAISTIFSMSRPSLVKAAKEQVILHWTPVKDENDIILHVALIIS